MTTHIQRAVSEVSVEPEARSEAGEADQRWREQDQIRLAVEQREKTQLRTRAEGFDD
jgi:hypothetical protein